MKIFLSNKDQVVPAGFTKVLSEHAVFLSTEVDDGEVEEFVLDGELETVEFAKVPHYLEFLTKKLSLGGVLNIVGVEATEICLSFFHRQLPIEALNTFVFGDKKRSLLTAEYVRSVLQQIGLEIVSQEFFEDRGTFNIIARKVQVG